MLGSSPLTMLPISWGKCGEWDPSPPSTTATLAASLGSSGGIRCLVAITTFHRGTGTGFSQAGGDDPQTTESGGPACPLSQGDRTLLEVAASVSSGAAFNTVLCLKRLQSRSDARLGTKHGVGLNDAAAVLTLPLCACVCARVHACVCGSWKKGSSRSAGGLWGVHPQMGAWDLCRGPCGGMFKSCRCLQWAGLSTSQFVLGTIRVRVGAGRDLGEGSSLLIAVALLTHAHAAMLGLEGCQRILEAELQEEPSGSP